MRVNFVLGLGIVLGLIGASLIVAFGVLYVKPYMNIRSMEHATCVVTSAHVVEDELVHCTCSNNGGGQCISQYPCLRILVNYSTSAKPHVQHIHNVTVYDSYDTFQLQGDKLQCSYHKCTEDVRNNLNSVKIFGEIYGHPGKRFPCYYLPTDLNYAIVEIITTVQVVHCMLWPTLALITGFTILIMYVFNLGPMRKAKSKHHFNSLERPWARYADRDYERVANDGRALVENKDREY